MPDVGRNKPTPVGVSGTDAIEITFYVPAKNRPKRRFKESQQY